MQGELSGRVALVTGSGRGLGRAYARALAGLGCSVMLNSPHRPEGATALAVAAEIKAAGGAAEVYVGSAADAISAVAAVDATVAAFGRIDILVSNAGTVVFRPFLQTSAADLEAMLAVHLAGPFAAVQHAYPKMAAQGRGRIVLTGTGSAAFGFKDQSVYAAAKAAIVGFSNVLKVEMPGDAVKINVVLPVALHQRHELIANLFDQFEPCTDRLDAAWVAPLICLLASDACPGTGGVYSAVAGRYARVFTAVTEGWEASGMAPPTLKEMAAHCDEILDGRRFDVPTSLYEEIGIVADRLRG